MFDLILEELDSRSGIDTSEIRNNIIQAYEEPKTKRAKERVSSKAKESIYRSTARSERQPKEVIVKRNKSKNRISRKYY